jgi:hypothetical protein
MNGPLQRTETAPIAGRSLQFRVGMFHDMTVTRDAQQCRDSAWTSRQQASTSAQPLLCLARAAWWETVAARVDAMGEGRKTAPAGRISQ